MEVPEKQEQQASSYTYWVRQTTSDAAPLPLPKKLSPLDLSNQSSQPPSLGSVWNRAGTWEEKSLSKWAMDRIKELLMSMGPLDFSNGKAEVTDVSSTGDAFLVTVRNKKRVGYSCELSIDVQGEWLFNGEKRKVNGQINFEEFSYGELDDLEIKVKIKEGKDLDSKDKQSISQDLKSFLRPIREKLLQFEQELRDR